MAKKAPAKKTESAPAAPAAAAAAAKPKAPKAMTKAQLIAHLAEKSELKKTQIAAVLEELLAVAFREAKKDSGFTFPGLGKLKVAKRQARMGINPKTREPIKIKAGKKLRFTFSKVAKIATGVAKKDKE